MDTFDIYLSEITNTNNDCVCCSICNDATNSVNVSIKKCSHKFHKQCINNWFETCKNKVVNEPGMLSRPVFKNNVNVLSCPVCKIEISYSFNIPHDDILENLYRLSGWLVFL